MIYIKGDQQEQVGGTIDIYIYKGGSATFLFHFNHWLYIHVVYLCYIVVRLRCCYIKGFKKLSFLILQLTQRSTWQIYQIRLNNLWWRPKCPDNMSQGTIPSNYRDTVGADNNEYYLQSKTAAKEFTGAHTGPNPKPILCSPLPLFK